MSCSQVPGASWSLPHALPAACRVWGLPEEFGVCQAPVLQALPPEGRLDLGMAQSSALLHLHLLTQIDGALRLLETSWCLVRL